MSRRYTSRTVVEAGTPQAWVAHWWRDEWAEETLNVCRRVYHTQRKLLLSGAYTTARFKPVEEHFKDWLVEKALEFRAGINPFTIEGDLETAWYRMLHANLTRVSKWHFWYYCREHGVNENYDPTIVWTTDSADRLTEEMGDAWAGDKYRQNQDFLLQDPEHILILLETLLNGPTADDFIEALKAPNLCEEYGCHRVKELRRWCKTHYTRHVEQWGDAGRPKCAQEGCPNYVVVRQWCGSHYGAERDRQVAAGTWQPRTLKEDLQCKVEGCTNVVGRDGRRGRCATHYREHENSKKGPCITDGCDRPARYSDGRCNACRAAWRKANADPCITPGCTKPGAVARGMCYTHYADWQKTKADPCVVDGCDKPGWKARGLCSNHASQRLYHENKTKPHVPCKITGCTNTVIRARGMCSTHYDHWRKEQADE